MLADRCENKETLIAELESAVRGESAELRVRKLREVTTLFLGSSSLSEEQIGVFDDVMCRLMARMESVALAQLGQCLAPIDHAPVETIRQLAWNEKIEVAGPVLTGSRQLTTSDLTAIAKERGQQHLLAISQREVVEPPVTDVLLDRGGHDVVEALARNTGAQFSRGGYESLVNKSDSNELLSELVGVREDIPLRLLRQLLERATEAVRAKILALVPPERIQQVASLLSSIAAAFEGDYDRYEAASRTIDILHSAGRLNDSTIRDFAAGGQIPEVVAALAVLNSSQIDVISDVLLGVRNDAVLVPCKAAGLGWETAEAILRNRLSGDQELPLEVIELAKSDYRKLSRQTAQKTLRFIQVRAVTK